MRIVIGENLNSVTVETEQGDNPADIVAVVEGLRSHQLGLPAPQRRPAKLVRDVVGSLDFQPRPAGYLNGTQSLNTQQYQTWSYLVDNDCEVGVHRAAVAREFNITVGAAGSRLSALVSLGYASRPSIGHYRPVDGDAKKDSEIQPEQVSVVVS